MEIVIEVLKIIVVGTLQALRETWCPLAVTMSMLGVVTYCLKGK